MKKIKMLMSTILIFTIILSFTACSNANKEPENPLNPDNPVTVVLWHYYNGNIKEKFDVLVSEFNETVGIEKGIVVDAQSQGDVDQLAMAMQDSASEAIGSLPMPDLFAAYPDTAFTVNKIKELVDLKTFFNNDELLEYRDEFLDEGRFISDDSLYILPIAKSTENIFINKTSWDEFASENNLTNENLKTWEGITKVAKLYYEKTGNSFFGIDANANYMLQASMQLGQEIYKYNEDQSVDFNLSEETARKIWENYYIPYIRGYFAKTGRFCSDDAKTGTVLSYVGSTAGASYFPTEVTFSQDDIVSIDVLTLPYPYFEDGKPFAMQQGAGICMTKSDVAHEYAAAEFLKWFTDTKQNLNFAVSTGYLPVKNVALNKEALIDALDEEQIDIPSIKSSLITTSEMFDEYEFYSNRPFDKSYEMRRLLETNLYDKVQSNLILLETYGLNELNKNQKIEELISEDSFKNWYKELTDEANKILES